MQSVDWIRKIKEEFEGKTIYTCEVGGTGGSRLNLNPANLSFCHDAELPNKPMEVDHICTESEFSVSLYYKKVYELLKNFRMPSLDADRVQNAAVKFSGGADYLL